MKKKPRFRGFRPWPKVQERLEEAEEFGLNVSEVINSVLQDHIDAYLVKDVVERRAKLDAIVKRLENRPSFAKLLKAPAQ